MSTAAECGVTTLVPASRPRRVPQGTPEWLPGVCKDGEQLRHVARLNTIFRDSCAAIDNSPTGTGKTYHSVFMAWLLGARHMLVVGPPSVKTTWETHLESAEQTYKRSRPVFQFVSYEGLRGKTSEDARDLLTQEREEREEREAKRRKADEERERAKRRKGEGNDDTDDGDGDGSGRASDDDSDASEPPCDFYDLSIVGQGMLARTDHIILTKEDGSARESPLHNVSYQPTECLRQFLSVPTLLVLDEFHNIKNASTNTQSARALIDPVLRAGTASPGRVLFLSATPMDKPEHMIRLVRTLGLLPDEHLVVPTPLARIADRRFQPRALFQRQGRTLRFARAIHTSRCSPAVTLFVAWCREVAYQEARDAKDRACSDPSTGSVFARTHGFADPILVNHDDVDRLVPPSLDDRLHNEKKRKEVLGMMGLSSDITHMRTTVEKYVLDLAHSVMLPALASKSKSKSKSKSGGDAEHAHPTVDAVFACDLRAREGIKSLCQSAHRVARNIARARSEKKHDAAKRLMGKITLVEQKKERLKIPLLIRVTRSVLESVPNSKVLIGVHFVPEVADPLLEQLRARGIAADTITGQTPTKKRDELRHAFQAPDLAVRVLVMTIGPLTQGVELDDQDGRFPRVALILPKFDAINTFQFEGRIMRTNTRSQPVAMYIYTDTENPMPPPGEEADMPPPGEEADEDDLDVDINIDDNVDADVNVHAEGPPEHGDEEEAHHHHAELPTPYVIYEDAKDLSNREQLEARFAEYNMMRIMRRKHEYMQSVGAESGRNRIWVESESVHRPESA